MKERTYDTEGYYDRTVNSRSLVYDQGIKTFVKENTGIMNRVRNMIDDIIKSEGRISHLEEEGLSVKYFSQFGDDDFESIEYGRPYFRVDASGQTFFCKKVFNTEESTDNINQQGGHKEIADAREGWSRVKHLPAVEIINYRFGYTSKDYSYVVSDFVHGSVKRLQDYLTLLKESNSPTSQSELEELNQRYDEIQALLSRYQDMTPRENRGVSNNIFYDPETKKIILFDLNQSAINNDAD